MKRESMVARVEAYLRARRALGYELRITGAELLRFARFADAAGHRGAVTADLAMRWARHATAATRQYQARRLDDVRCFAKYQLALEPDTEIPPTGVLGPPRRRRQPYIFEASEISALVSAANRLPPTRGIRGSTYATLLGVLACTGMRISEALQLKRADADLEAGVLSIRKTKFKKSRLIPVHRSALDELRRYVAKRDATVPDLAGATLLVCRAGRPLPYSTVRTVFRKLIDQIVPQHVSTHRRPRIHDLRHTFACRAVLRWYRDGVDVDQRIAALSTYLGHAKVSDTYWYLTGVPELMAIAAARFERFGCEGSSP